MSKVRGFVFRLAALAAFSIVVSPARCVAAGEEDATVILADDFSSGEIDPAKWVVGVPKTEGSFARTEDGALHVVAYDKQATLTTRAEIPPEYLLEFDYFQPSAEKRGGYQNSVSYSVTRRAEGQKWSGGVWYIESSGVTYSHCGGTWNTQAKLGAGCSPGQSGFPPSTDKWYRVQVFNRTDLTVMTIRDRDGAGGKVEGRVVFRHDPVLAGRVRFTAGAAGKGARWGFKLDNVRIAFPAGKLSGPAAPLLLPALPRVAKSWEPLEIAGRGFWHMHRPSQFEGLASLPLFAESAWYGAPADPERLAKMGRPFALAPGGGDRAADIARNAGREFLGFTRCLSEWGDGILRSACRSGQKITNRDEGLAEMEREYRKRASRAPVSADIFSWLGYRLFYHHSCEWGARALICETGEQIPCTNLQLAFMRGAAREYGKPWGVDISAWFWGRVNGKWTGTMTNYVATPDFNDAC